MRSRVVLAGLALLTVAGCTYGTAPRTVTPPTSAAPTSDSWGTPLPASDEFDYEGAPDPKKWGVYNGAGHDGNGRRLPEQVEVTGGKMILTGNTEGDTAGLAHKLGQQYGRWEVRARTAVMEGSGKPYSPVLIVWPDSNQWPEDGEYDFFEPGSPSSTTLKAFMHIPNTDNDQESFKLEGIDVTQWHEYGFEWTSEELVGYVDGEEWFRTDTPGITDMPSGHLTVQLDNFDSNQPSTFEIDWVRVYPA
jgi:hypothetical protein